MEKNEEILLNEPEINERKPSQKIKYAIAIITTTLALAVVSTLLIGHFKFDWFKSNNYKIDAQINRSVYQSNYFSEKKTVKTQFSLPSGTLEQKTYVLDSNFVVFLTEKKDDFNTAILILLDSIMTSEEGKKELAHLNLFNDEEIKQLEKDPDGAKYPMAIFQFYDDGKIEMIKLPNNMDEYNAETIIDLIEKVTPKLSRNRKEDLSNGLDIQTRKENNKRIIVQGGAPKQYKEFERSRYYRVVRTEIEDEQISKVESDSNLQLSTQPEKDQLILGPKDFSFNIKSEIVSSQVKLHQEKNIKIANELAEKFTFVDSKVLIDSFKEKKEKEKEEKVEEETEPLRQLFPISASKEFNLVSFSFLGQTITIKYVVSVSSSRAVNKLVITSGLGTINFGNEGCSGEVSNSYNYNKHIFTFTFPNFPAVKVGCYATGYLSWSFGFQSGSGTGTKYYATLSGKLALGAEIKAGWDKIASLSAYAEGTVADARGQVTISNGSVAKGSGFSLQMGALVAGIRGCLFSNKIDLVKEPVFSGWRVA